MYPEGGDDVQGTTNPPMSDAKASELVALIFARTATALTHPTWQDLIGLLTSHLKSRFGYHEGSGAPYIRFLDQPITATSGRVCELKLLTTTTTPSLATCKTFTDSPAFHRFQTDHGVEIVLQPGALYTAHRTAGLAVFDMDSTLIRQEVIDELARAVGRYDRVAAITAAAMRGEPPYTDFAASLRARVALRRGVPATIWRDLRADVITFTPGAAELVRALRARGWKTAVLSGGFVPLAEWVREALGMDYAFANHLVEDAAGELTGELVEGEPIVDGEKKRELLVELAGRNGVPVERVVAVGDGSNDLLMMETAGLGIAFHAKPKVQALAPTRLNSESLLDVMYILGFTREEIDEALKR
jgi:phosphoserine phosphatase